MHEFDNLNPIKARREPVSKSIFDHQKQSERSPSFRTVLVMGRARGDRNERAVSVSGMVDRLLAVVTRDRARARTRVQPIIEPQV